MPPDFPAKLIQFIYFSFDGIVATGGEDTAFIGDYFFKALLAAAVIFFPDVVQAIFFLLEIKGSNVQYLLIFPGAIQLLRQFTFLFFQLVFFIRDIVRAEYFQAVADIIQVLLNVLYRGSPLILFAGVL